MGVDVAVTVAPNNVTAQFDGPGGTQGSVGQQGGPIPVPYAFSTTTTSADPGSGVARLNNATQNTATAAYISTVGADAATWGPIFAQIAAVSSVVKGWLRVSKSNDATKWLLFKITAAANNATWYSLTLANIASSAASPFAAADALTFHFITNGDLGTVGGAIPVPYVFSTTTTSADPGSGNARLNNATQNTATQAYISTTGSDAATWGPIFAAMGAVSSSVKGYLRVAKTNDPTKWLLFKVTLAVNNTTWYSLNLTNVASSAASPFANSDALTYHFSTNGDLGSSGSAISIAYTFSTTTTSGNPGAGVMRLGSATENTSVAAYLSTTDVNAVDWSLVLAAMGNSSSVNKGYLRVSNLTDPTKFLVFSVQSAVLGGSGWYSLVLMPMVSSAASPFANSDPVVISFTPNGDTPVPFRNRLINGDMRIDQRKVGASSTVTATGYTTVDRWEHFISVASKITVGQNLGAAALPTGQGFLTYLGAKTAAAYAVTASDFFAVVQQIEGVNVADLMFGTASAKNIVLSTWVQSSLTGTFGGVVKNGSGTRCYPFTYSIPVANTWTYITVSIPGDTTGTWATDNSAGLLLCFGLGCGSTFSATAGTWGTVNAISATGAVSVVGTLNATLYITGTQLEIGTVPTAFDFRPLDIELVRCRRYYENNMPAGSAPGDGVTNALYSACGYQTNGLLAPVTYKTEKRVTPTLTFWKAGGANATNGLWGFLTAGAWADVTATTLNRSTTKDFAVSGSPTITNGAGVIAAGGWAADAEL